MYAKDDSNTGDDQSQQGNGSSSGNGGNGSSFSSAERPSFEDSDNSTTSSHSTPPAVFMETANPEHRQSRQRNTQHQDNSQSCQQDGTNSSKSN